MVDVFRFIDKVYLFILCIHHMKLHDTTLDSIAHHCSKSHDSTFHLNVELYEHDRQLNTCTFWWNLTEAKNHHEFLPSKNPWFEVAKRASAQTLLNDWRTALEYFFHAAEHFWTKQRPTNRIHPMGPYVGDLGGNSNIFVSPRTLGK